RFPVQGVQEPVTTAVPLPAMLRYTGEVPSRVPPLCTVQVSGRTCPLRLSRRLCPAPNPLTTMLRTRPGEPPTEAYSGISVMSTAVLPETRLHLRLTMLPARLKPLYTIVEATGDPACMSSQPCVTVLRCSVVPPPEPGHCRRWPYCVCEYVSLPFWGRPLRVR